MQVPPLLYPERVADATLRGFLTQIFYSAMRWLELGDRELLLCEGDEDVDRYFFNADGSLREIRQEQIKDLSGSLSARSNPVYESLFNFLVSFVEHHRQGRRCVFVFVTNAERAGQRVKANKSTADVVEPGKTKVALSIDVLETWARLAASGDPDKTVRPALIESVRALVDGYAVDPPPPDPGQQKDPKSKKSVPAARVHAALEYLDEEDVWVDFLASVEWRLEQPSHAAVESLLYERFRGDPRTAHAPELLAQKAVVAVLRASSRADAPDRLLSRAQLDTLVQATDDELAAWAAKYHPERISGWLQGLEKKVHEQRGLLDQTRVQVQELASRPHERVRHASDRALARLKRSASLTTANGHFTISRPVADAMAAMKGRFLVVGDPGAGKSGALFSFVEVLRAAGEDVVVASADALPDPDALLAALQEWPTSASPRTLVIDALDAARGETAAAAVRAFLQDLLADDHGWRVVASIRTFDLRARSELVELFDGTPSAAFGDRRFPTVAHIRVGRLTDAELAQLTSGHAALGALVQTASTKLQGLLRTPFHLALVSQLLASGATGLELENVRSQLELLDRYWHARVGSPPEGMYARQALLKRACDEIVRARVFWADIDTLPQLDHLPALLSGHVLVHPAGVVRDEDQGRVGFSHHVLFDYACARLWMPETAAKLVEALRANSDLILVARPSLDMRLRQLWDADPQHAPFWEAVLAVAADASIAEAAQIVGATVAADSAADLEDFRALLAALETDAGRPSAVRALTHIIASCRLRAADMASPAALTAEPWPSLVDAIVTNSREDAWWSILPLVRDACAAKPTGEAAKLLGRAARAVLTWACSKEHAQLVGMAARAVSETFASDPTASEGSLAKLLEPSALAAWGHETFLALAENAPSIFLVAPTFVEDLYRVAFRVAFEEQPDEQPVQRGGPVMGFALRPVDMMRSATHRLAKDFPALLARDPVRGVRVLVSILETFRPKPPSDPKPGGFAFAQRPAQIVEDVSEVWDQKLHGRGESQLQMLDAWEARLVEVCASPGMVGARDAFLDALAREGTLAALWRRTLHAASTHPKTVGAACGALLSVSALLSSPSTTTQAGEALRQVFPGLGPSERLSIERAILELGGDDAPSGGHRSARARLLGCLPRPHIVSDEAKAAFDAIAAKDGFPKNEPAFQMRTSIEPFDEDRDLRRRGIDLDGASAKLLHTALAPLRAFLSRTDNALPSTEEITRAVRDAQEVVAILSNREDPPPPEVLLEHAWAKIAAVSERIVERARELAAVGFEGELATVVFAAVAADAVQGPDGGHLRGALARAMWGLATGGADVRKIRDQLEEWANDADAHVRYEVYRNIHVLALVDDVRFQRLLAHAIATETDELVWGGLGSAMNELVATHPKPVRDLGLHALGLVEEVRIREIFVHQLASLAVRGDSSADGRTMEIVRDPSCGDAHALATHLADLLQHEPTNPADRAISERTQHLGEDLAQGAAAALESWRKQAEGDQEKAKAIAGVLDALARPLTLAIEHLMTLAMGAPERRARIEGLFGRVDRILHTAAMTGEAVLVHQVVETLPARRLLDRRAAFLQAAELVRSGFRGGYQTDTLAANTIVAFLERYLADDRALLQDDPVCRRALFEVLDIFVRAGWENARRLTYGLDEIFR